jgi:hypothetical protein
VSQNVRLLKVSLADFPSSFHFAHFFSLELCSHCLTKNKHCLWLVGPKIFQCQLLFDFLTTTDAVTENPQKYLAAEKYY